MNMSIYLFRRMTDRPTFLVNLNFIFILVQGIFNRLFLISVDFPNSVMDRMTDGQTDRQNFSNFFETNLGALHLILIFQT